MPNLAALLASRGFAVSCRIVTGALAALLALALLVFAAGAPVRAQNAAEDQGVLAGFLSRLLSTPTSRVSIGAVEGALSSNATIRDITVADEEGVFLSIDSVRLVWRRAALLQRRIEVQQLEIGRITYARPPRARGEPEPGPILPELPLALRVDAFRLGELVLGAPVLGAPARLSATGSASLGAPAEGLRADLAVRRLDAPGDAALNLVFTPQGERLDLTLRLQEPAGGLLARVAGIPGEPPVRLDLTGAGTLDDWRSRLVFEGGPEIGARGEATLSRAGAARVLRLDLDSRVTALLPPLVAPVFEGATTLSGAVAFPDGGGLDLRDLRLSSRLAELVLAGSVSPDRTLDLTARARALPAAAERGEARLERLLFEGSVNGPAAAPQVSGRIDLAGLSTPALAVASVEGGFSAAPLPGGGRLALQADIAARGVVPADPALARALGRDLALAVRGELDEAGVATLRQARLSSPTLALGYEGRLGRRLVDGLAEARILRLDAFSDLAGCRLGGALRLTAALKGDPSRSNLAASLAGETEGLTLGDPRLDRFAGPRLKLAGEARLSAGRLVLQDFGLEGGGFRARLGGALSASDLALQGALSLPDLARLDERLRGAAEATLRLSGPTADPSADLTLDAARAEALGRPVRGLSLRLEARRALTLPALTLAVNGEVDGKPLSVDARLEGGEVEVDGARAWTLPRLEGRVGSVALSASGRLGAEGFAAGRGSLAAGDLNDLSPLLLRPLAGRLDARFEAAIGGQPGAPAQRFSVDANGEALAFNGLRVGKLAAVLSVEDAYRLAGLRGEARLEGLTAGGQSFEVVSLTATEAGSGASEVRARAAARGFDLAGDARVEPGAQTRILLRTFRASRAGRALTLAGPSVLTIGEGGLRSDGLALAIGGGRIEVEGVLGRDLDARIRVRALPLAAAEIALPGLGLAGTLEGDATLSGSAAAPNGDYALTARQLVHPALRGAGLPPLDVAARGRLAGERITLDATVRGGRAIDLAVEGSAPLAGEGALDLRLRGQADAALANARLAASGQRLAGRLTLDARIAGTRADPRLEGSAILAGGSFSDPVRGVAITALEGRFTGRGETVAVERLTGRAGAGSLTASGSVTVDPGRGFPAELQVRGARATLVDGPLARLVANLDLTVSGPLASAPRLSGRLDVLDLELRVPDRLGGASAPLRDARHVAPPPQTRARLAQAARLRQGARRAGPPFRAALDLVIDAPGRIFVRGRGIDAELGGSLRLTGTTLDPVAIGAFELRRGRFTLLTQRLDFTRGRLSFGGGLVPELDFLAETRAGEVTARIAVTGPANAPSFVFSSTPALPEDEVLSRLLFARAAGGLSPFQALQLAQAVGQLSGNGGSDLFESTRRALGVDDLDIGFGAGGPTVGLSRAISDRIRLGVRAGARPESTGVGVDIDLTRRLRIQSEIGADGRASVGVGIEQEY